MLMYFAILSFGAWTLTGITEEKAKKALYLIEMDASLGDARKVTVDMRAAP